MESRFLEFKHTVMTHYRRHGRHELPWRKTSEPYAIVVSESMLQQTQVERVVPFYEAFVARFPSFISLARARSVNVLKMWQGLGYNRRALMLRRCARMVIREHGGALPDTFEELKKLPGFGPYTAGAVMAFAFNKPHPIIETNIRRVYIHHFFPRSKRVDDRRILPLVESSMNRRNPRIWFGALMDYGSWLSQRIPNPNRKSRQYIRQSSFEGSDRQVRGAIIRDILGLKRVSEADIRARFDVPLKRISAIIDGLIREGFLVRTGEELRCA